MDNFVLTVVSRFKKITPVWTPPHGLIFDLATGYGWQAKINGMTRAFYEKNATKLFDNLELDEDLEVVLYNRRKQVAKVAFCWLDCRKLVVK